MATIAGLAELVADSGTSAPAAFTATSEPGDTVTGTVTSVRTRQRRDAKTRKPMFWDAEGAEEKRPQVQVVITLDTGIESAPDPETGETTTERTVFLKAWGDSWKAFTGALRTAGLADLPEGATLTATYLRDVPPANKSMSPTKVYGFKVDR